MKTLCTTFACLCSLFVTSALATPNDEIARFGLFIGANNGGEDRISLKYATDDAQSVGKVFRELGGLAEKNQILILNPGTGDIDHGFKQLLGHLDASTSPRKEVFIYYSGHSNDQGLLLKDGSYRFSDLRQKIAEIKSDVKLAILDSCESEAFMRTKGGKREAPFMFDESNKVKGQVFLTSSSENEAAQESENIKGSFFTHYLVSAMRGAGDLSADKRITLNEAYQFAYQETLARTESSRAGAQHAAYDMQLTGAGDLVLTDLRESMSVLSLAGNIQGRVFIRDNNDRLVIELNKHAGKNMNIGLEPARYRVLVDAREKLYETSISLSFRENKSIDLTSFGEVDRRKFVRKGGVLPDNNYDSKIYFAAGVQSLPISISPETQSYNYSHNLNYLGFNTAVHWQYHPDARIVWDIYRLSDKGTFYGSSLDFQYDFISFYQNKFRIYFGIGAYFDVLYKFWDNQWEVPVDQASYLEYGSNYNLKLPFGLRFQGKNIGFEIATHLKPNYNDGYLGSEQEGFPFVARLLYKF